MVDSVIDAHQHVWRIGRHGQTWPGPDLAAIHRDFDMEAFQALARPAGIAGSVLVQSQPADADTDFLLDVARDHPFVRAVAGWVDMEAPGAPERLRALARRPAFRGVRPMLQALADDHWIAEARIDRAVEALIERKLTFDALVFTRHLAPLRRFMRRWPDLPVVVDHAAKPPVAAGDLGRWRDELAETAALPNAWCKLSGLATEAGPHQGADELAPVVEHVLAVFGPDRVMWGGDWPVLTLAGEYGPWLALCRALTPGPARERVFGLNAGRFYRLAGGAIDRERPPADLESS